ncbi:hypothetical protein [Streptomyces sp. NPDC058667]|uniref:hypothetical protein n=1 Tax=Streptomyces sp. NPDC058667 TaxID=3346588 RepID=UPI003655BCDC
MNRSLSNRLPYYERPLPALLARADRSFARFLGHDNEDQEHDANGPTPGVGHPGDNSETR